MFEQVNNLLPNALPDVLPWQIYDKLRLKNAYIPIVGCSPFNHPMTTAWHMKPESIFPHTSKYRLFRAIVENDINEVKCVLDQSFFDIDSVLEEKYGTTAMSLAAWFNRTAILKYLILRGADIDKFDQKGNTPLMLAVKNINYSAIANLIEAGADILLKDQYSFDCIQKAKIRGFHILTDFLERKAKEREEIISNSKKLNRKRPWNLPKFNIKFSFEENEVYKEMVTNKKIYLKKPNVYPFNDFKGTYYVSFAEIWDPLNENY